MVFSIIKLKAGLQQLFGLIFLESKIHLVVKIRNPYFLKFNEFSFLTEGLKLPPIHFHILSSSIQPKNFIFGDIEEHLVGYHLVGQKECFQLRKHSKLALSNENWQGLRKRYSVYHSFFLSKKLLTFFLCFLNIYFSINSSFWRFKKYFTATCSAYRNPYHQPFWKFFFE